MCFRYFLLLQIENIEPDIFYTDATGFRNKECLSLGCDQLRLFHGRSPVEMYQDFTEAFVDCFEELFGKQNLTLAQLFCSVLFCSVLF